MTVLGREPVPTRSVLLELRAERGFIREGHEFLDQKRILLATEIQRLLVHYDRLHADMLDLHARAVVALAEAFARHGFDFLSIHPTVELASDAITTQAGAFLGIPLVTEARVRDRDAEPPVAEFSSPEARAARDIFERLVERAVEFSAVSASIEQLISEYVRTERRAKALENVILPELDRAIRRVDGQLAEQAQEDVVRARLRR